MFQSHYREENTEHSWSSNRGVNLGGRPKSSKEKPRWARTAKSVARPSKARIKSVPCWASTPSPKHGTAQPNQPNGMIFSIFQGSPLAYKSAKDCVLGTRYGWLSLAHAQTCLLPFYKPINITYVTGKPIPRPRQLVINPRFRPRQIHRPENLAQCGWAVGRSCNTEKGWFFFISLFLAINKNMNKKGSMPIPINLTSIMGMHWEWYEIPVFL